MGIRIDALDPAANVQADHEIPAMRSGATVKLTAEQIATFVIALVTDSAPATLDTLNELAAALGDDPNFATTVTNALAAKASLTGAETLTNKTLTSPVINSAVSGEFLRGHLRGLTASNNVSDATNDIDVATGSAASVGTTPVLMTLASAMTKRLDANWSAGSGNGMRYSGAAIANGFYYLFLVSTAAGAVDIYADPSPDEAVALAHLQAETGGASYVNIRRFWSIWRDAGAIRPFRQEGDRCYLSTQALAYSNTNLPTTKTTVASGAPTGIRTIAMLNVRGVKSAAPFGISVWCPDLATPTTVDGSVAVSSGANEIAGLATNSSTSVGVSAPVDVLTDATGQIALQCAATATQVAVQLRGWVDTRGRN